MLEKRPDFKELLLLVKAERGPATSRLNYYEEEQLKRTPREGKDTVRAKYAAERSLTLAWLEDEERYLQACIEAEEKEREIPSRVRRRPAPRAIYKPERFFVDFGLGLMFDFSDLPPEVEGIMMLVSSLVKANVEQALLDLTFCQIKNEVLALWERADECASTGRGSELDDFLKPSSSKLKL